MMSYISLVVYWVSLSKPHTSVYGWTISLYIRPPYCICAHSPNILLLPYIFRVSFRKYHKGGGGWGGGQNAT